MHVFIITVRFQMQRTNASVFQGFGNAVQGLEPHATTAHGGADVKFVDNRIKPAEFYGPAEGDHDVTHWRLARADLPDGPMWRAFQKRRQRGALLVFRRLESALGVERGHKREEARGIFGGC